MPDPAQAKGARDDAASLSMALNQCNASKAEARAWYLKIRKRYGLVK